MLQLKRLLTNRMGLFGVLIYEGEILCYSLERPWLGNVKDKSCIPCGVYDVIKANSPRFGQVFYVKDVPGREGILIHPGNDLSDTRGCILVGNDAQYPGLVRSRVAIDRLNLALPRKFKLQIQEAF